jgi:hypothetical protein
MNARVDLPQAREVCPTATRCLLADGALLVDVRELAEVAQVAFNVPGVALMPLSEREPPARSRSRRRLPRPLRLDPCVQALPDALAAAYRDRMNALRRRLK